MVKTSTGLGTSKSYSGKKTLTAQEAAQLGGFSITQPIKDITPMPKAPTPPLAPAPKPENKVYRDTKGGISGIEIGGKTYLGLNPQDVEQMAQAELRRTQGGIATQQFEKKISEQEAAILKQQEAEQKMQIQQENAQLAQGVLGVPPITETPQASPFDISQTALRGVSSAIPSIITNVGTGAAIGAGVGAAGGAGVGAVPGAIIGGVAGLIKGVWQGVQGSLAQQASDNIQAQSKTLSDGKSNLKRLISLAKADPVRADVYLSAYQQQKAQIAESYGKLKLETERDLYKFLGKDGSTALKAYASFYSNGGLAEIYDTNMQLALLGKNPEINDLIATYEESTQTNE